METTEKGRRRKRWERRKGQRVGTENFWASLENIPLPIETSPDPETFLVDEQVVSEEKSKEITFFER